MDVGRYPRDEQQHQPLCLFRFSPRLQTLIVLLVSIYLQERIKRIVQLLCSITASLLRFARLNQTKLIEDHHGTNNSVHRTVVLAL